MLFAALEARLSFHACVSYHNIQPHLLEPSWIRLQTNSIVAGSWVRPPPRADAHDRLCSARAREPPVAKIDRKIKIGLVGCGGRGSWIAGLFKQHGGYQFVAAADYFQDPPTRRGASLGVEKSKCFSGLSAYKRVIAAASRPCVLETPPHFFPEHAEAAVQAGLHVYMAKPVAVDVPGA